MVNAELSRLFDLMADLLEIQDANRFRVNAHRRVARTLKDLTQDVAELVREDRLRELPGIGKGTVEKVKEYLAEGSIRELAELQAGVPEGLPDLLQIRGLGPKKVAAVWKELNVEGLADLKAAIDDGKLEQLPGFGKQSAQKIADGIAFMETSGGRVPYGEALGIAEAMLQRVSEFDGVRQAAIVGSLRRGRETIGDIDLLCCADGGEAVVKSFVRQPDVAGVLAAGATKGSVLMPIGNDRQVQIDLRVVPRESFGAALQYFSGSKEHNVRLREIAVKKGCKLNEWGLFEGDKQIAGQTEEGVYAKLGLPYIPVEMREDRGEFGCDQAFFDSLVSLEDIKGDLHMHTVASDGKSTLEQMARAAKERGYAFINIADHSKSSAIAGGLSIERMERQIEEVRAFDKSFDGLKVFVGCECDILSGGGLDYPDELLAECDFVVASIHAAQTQDRQTITRRTIKAIENPHVHILGHPTGRLLNKRPPSAIDMAEVITAAVETGTALEINASWKRLDLKDKHIQQALDAGAMLSINTDAHHTDQLDQMRFGVSTARRGWAPRKRIINCLGVRELMKWRSCRG